MKVSLAAQTLSASVADSLKYCRDTLELSQFQDSEGTEMFIRLIDHLFDLMNISSRRGRGWKGPINSENERSVTHFLETAFNTLSNITDKHHNLMIQHSRKTPFIGLCINADSVQQLINEFVRTRRWEYLLTYKFSQDHLELLFNCIRRTGERNTALKCLVHEVLGTHLLFRY